MNKNLITLLLAFTGILMSQTAWADPAQLSKPNTYLCISKEFTFEITPKTLEQDQNVMIFGKSGSTQVQCAGVRNADVLNAICGVLSSSGNILIFSLLLNTVQNTLAYGVYTPGPALSAGSDLPVPCVIR